MDRLKRDVVLIRLIEALRDKKSWCGETHVQKATFFLQEMAGADMGFDFILYKHGPFSFDLRDELVAMRADGLVALRISEPGYGPSIVPESAGESLKQRFPITLSQHEPLVVFVADKFENKPVVELERLGTAFYFMREGKKKDKIVEAVACAQRINKIKPHITVDQATEAIRTVEEWQREAAALKAKRGSRENG